MITHKIDSFFSSSFVFFFFFLLFLSVQFPVFSQLNRKMGSLHKSRLSRRLFQASHIFSSMLVSQEPGFNAEVTKEGAHLQYVLKSLKIILAYSLIEVIFFFQCRTNDLFCFKYSNLLKDKSLLVHVTVYHNLLVNIFYFFAHLLNNRSQTVYVTICDDSVSVFYTFYLTFYQLITSIILFIDLITNTSLPLYFFLTFLPADIASPCHNLPLFLVNNLHFVFTYLLTDHSQNIQHSKVIKVLEP